MRFNLTFVLTAFIYSTKLELNSSLFFVGLIFI